MIYILSIVFIFLLRLRFPRNQPIIQVIERRYGRRLVILYRKYERLCKKFNKCQCDISFLKICKSYNIVPKFLRFKLYKRNLYDSKLYKQYQFKLLQSELNSKQKLSRTLNCQIDLVRDELKSVLSYLDFVFLNSLIDKTLN